MKFLWCSDIHATGKSPNSRIDNYSISIQEKLIEIGEIANNEKVDYIIIGGDLFHVPVIANSYAGEIAKIIRAWKKIVFVVPGNHDITGYNISTLKHSTLGMFESTGVVSLVTREKPIKGKLGNKIVALESQEYCVGIDEDVNSYNKRVDADFNILFAHGMLVAKPILEGIKHVVISDIPNPADITFSGHDHGGYGILTVNDKTFINNGSIGRTDCGKAMQKHRPSVIISTIENVNGRIVANFKEIFLKSAKPFKEVFKEIQDTTLKDDFVSFVNNIRTLDIKETNQDDFFDKLLDEKVINNDINEMCKDYISMAKKSLNTNVVKSITREKSKVYISKIEIKNFLSHKDSTIEFCEGLNIISGENGCGKSSIFEAIQYVLFDTPKGTEFIRTGSNSCEVKITFNNGNYIRKVRAKTKGTYYVYDGKTEETYEGYANNLPTQIADVHQMPMINLFKDKLISLNYADQHDGLFLMNLSPSEKAEAIGTITGTDILDEAINIVSADIRDKKKLSTSMKNKIDSLRIEEDLLAKKQKKIQEIADRVNEVDSLLSALRSIENINSERIKYTGIVKELNNRKALIDNALIKIGYINEDCDKSVEVSKTYINYIDGYNKKNKCMMKIISLNNILDKIQILINNLKDYNDVFKYINDYFNNTKAINSLNKKNIDISRYTSLSNRLIAVDEIYNAYSIYAKSSKSIGIIKNNLFKIISDLENNSIFLKDIDIKIDTLAKELEQIGICPMCSKPLDDDSIHYILHKEGY